MVVYPGPHYDPETDGIGGLIAPHDPAKSTIPPLPEPVDPALTRRLAREVEERMASHQRTHDPRRIFGYDPFHEPELQLGRHVASAILRLHSSQATVGHTVAMTHSERAHCVHLLRTCGCVVSCRSVGVNLHAISSSRRMHT